MFRYRHVRKLIISVTMVSQREHALTGKILIKGSASICVFPAEESGASAVVCRPWTLATTMLAHIIVHIVMPITIESKIKREHVSSRSRQLSFAGTYRKRRQDYDSQRTSKIPVILIFLKIITQILSDSACDTAKILYQTRKNVILFLYKP